MIRIILLIISIALLIFSFCIIDLFPYNLPFALIGGIGIGASIRN